MDISFDQDLSIGVMNLIAAEEHLFFTAQKTRKTKYYKLLKEVREKRTFLMKKMLGEVEGELWCTSKHLLSATMRLYEAGNKKSKEGDSLEAEKLYDKSFQCYKIFLELLNKKGETKEELFKRLLDCCDE